MLLRSDNLLVLPINTGILLTQYIVQLETNWNSTKGPRHSKVLYKAQIHSTITSYPFPFHVAIAILLDSPNPSPIPSTDH